MADVFVSYKSEDRRRVQPLVAALEADGLDVWWDAQIGGGSDWRETIQEHLDSARCVVVAWSKHSVGPGGRFVRDEATRAQRRGVYLPVRLDNVEPPLGFGETQAVSLIGWKGDRAAPRYRSLLAHVHETIGKDEHTPVAAAPDRSLGVDRRLVLAGGGLLALGVAGAGAWSLLRPSEAAAHGIVVLPFANLTGDPAQRYFSDGLAEELRVALNRIRDLKVIGRTSSEAVRDAEAREASRQLGVGNVLTGSVRRSPSMIRVNAQLIDGADGAQRWAETYDRSPDDTLAVQADIAENVARALSIELGQAERAALTVGGTRNAAAHDLYLKAKEQRASDSSEAGWRHAIALLDAALAMDPSFADAYAQKAVLLVDVTGNYAGSQAALASGFREANIAANRAIEIAPKLPTSYVALADLAASQFDARTGLAMHERALSLGARDGETLSAYGSFLALLGRSGEAVHLADEAVALDPFDPFSHTRRSVVLFWVGRYADAIASSRRVLQMAPKRQGAHLVIGNSLVMLDRPKQALAEYATLTDFAPHRLTGEAIAYAALGDRAASDRAFAGLREFGKDAAHYQYAQVHAMRGEIDQAFAALNLAWKFRDPGLMLVRADPFLDRLRRDPRLSAIERRLKLPSA